MSSNPFSDVSPANPYSPNNFNAPPEQDGYTKQIPIIGILNIVQACLELFAGVGLGGMAVFMGTMSTDPKFAEALEKGNVSPQFLVWVYLGIGSVIAIIGAMRLVSGIMTLRRRGRIFSIVASIVGLGTVFTCYCAPSAIALAVYTLVVLIQPSVMAEYERAKQSS
ncbi:MAG: hypothetical protein ABL921_28850 [Pirellula sp.]